jgi:hypothetical protein
MSLNRVTVILTIAGAILVWALTGSGFVYYLARENIKYRADYKLAMAAIFDYQSRYDGVYEKAYPAGRQVRTTAENSGVKKSSLAVDESELGDADFSVGRSEPAKGSAKVAQAEKSKSPVIPTLALSPALAPAPALTPSVLPVISDAKVADAIPGTSEWMLDLEKPSIEKKGKGFDLNFALRNRQRDQKADGYVWAIATVIRESGETVHFPAPVNLPIDNQGNATDGRRAHKFSIRHYIVKKFNFETPKGVSGILTNIDIGLMNQDGSSKIFKVPLKFKVDLPVVQPEGTTKPGPSAKTEGDADEPVEQGA